jgi:hypothetical protein
MTEQYSIDIEKLSRSGIGPLAYLFADLKVSDDAAYFDEIRHLLLIPEKPKSLDEIQEELDSCIDDIIRYIKNKFKNARLQAERTFTSDITILKSNFEYAKRNGYFPQKLNVLTGKSGNFIVASTDYVSVCSHDILKIGSVIDSSGCYEIDSKLKIFLTKKPSFINKFFVRLFLNWKWRDND